MIEQDTIKLLRECDAGVKMGISSISDVSDHVHCSGFREKLETCKKEHDALDREIQAHLDRFGDEGKEPNMIAKDMSWMKTKMKLSINASDKTIADLITDGCNMGVKSLNMYLNKYEAADETAKDIAKRLIQSEETLGVGIRKYL